MRKVQGTNKDSGKRNDDIRSLAQELICVKKQAEALGIFTNDRELLECTGCDLVEDVAFDGSLMTCHKNADGFDDTSLRFEEVDDGKYRCPVCGTVLKAVIL